MVGRNVQQLEIVQIAFNFTAIENLETHVAEHCRNVAQGLSTRMQAAQIDRVPWQRDIHLVA